MNGFKLFGFSIQRPSDDKPLPESGKLAVPKSDDGASVITAGGAYDSLIALDPTSIIGNEVELINSYRNMALQDTCAEAIDTIVAEAMIYEEGTDDVVQLKMDDIDIDEGLKEEIQNEFDTILTLLNFKTNNHDIFKQWYIDGRLFFQVVIDPDNTQDGIKELVPLDPRTIKKVKEIEVAFTAETGTQVQKTTKEYFIYDPKGISVTPSYSIGTMSALNAQGTQVAPDSIVYVHSGCFDTSHTVILSHLHKAIKPLNMLINIEDALIIYRLSRAPRRLVFYVDVGGLPPTKAESYVKNLMAGFKNKLSYNSSTGEIASQTRISTMTENYFLPRREGGKATEITQLQEGQNLDQVQDLVYFKKKLYVSLNLPNSRIEASGGSSGGSGTNNGGMAMQGRATEILRDEVKFSRFLARLRKRFSDIFYQLLRRQLILKGIIDAGDWEVLRDQLVFEWPVDNHFTELKDLEIQTQRINLAAIMDGMVGKYYSREYIKRRVLKLTDEELEDMDREMSQEEDMLAQEQQEQLEADIAKNEALGQAAAGGGESPFGGDEDGEGDGKFPSDRAADADEGDISAKGMKGKFGKFPPGKDKSLKPGKKFLPSKDEDDDEDAFLRQEDEDDEERFLTDDEEEDEDFKEEDDDDDEEEKDDEDDE